MIIKPMYQHLETKHYACAVLRSSIKIPQQYDYKEIKEAILVTNLEHCRFELEIYDHNQRTADHIPEEEK